MSMVLNFFNEEQLPISFGTADVPLQCLDCPGFLMKVVTRPDEDGQGVSDAVREMQLCQTGPVEQYETEGYEIVAPYSPSEARGLLRNAFLMGSDRMVRTDKDGSPVSIVTCLSRLTPRIIVACGLEARPDRLPKPIVENDPGRAEVLTEQLQNHKRHLVAVRLAGRPALMATAGRGNGIHDLLVRNRPVPRGNETLMHERVAEVNAARAGFNMSPYEITAELYAKYGLTPPTELSRS